MNWKKKSTKSIKTKKWSFYDEVKIILEKRQNLEIKSQKFDSSQNSDYFIS